MKDIFIITCPVCGAEYHPTEIFIPNSFFGRPNKIMKDEASGKIEFILGSDMDLTEEYTCNYCNTKFKVTAKLDFSTEVSKEASFEEEYVSTFNKPKKLKLSEVELFD